MTDDSTRDTIKTYHRQTSAERAEIHRAAYSGLSSDEKEHIDEAVCDLVNCVRGSSKMARFSETNALELLGALAVFLLEMEVKNGPGS